MTYKILPAAILALTVSALPAFAQEAVYATTYTDRSETIPAFDQDAAAAFNQGRDLDADSHVVGATAPVVVTTQGVPVGGVPQVAPAIAPGAGQYMGGDVYAHSTTTTTTAAPTGTYHRSVTTTTTTGAGMPVITGAPADVIPMDMSNSGHTDR